MIFNFYKKYLEENLKDEIEELDLYKAKDFLTKEFSDSSTIKGTTFLFKKDRYFKTIPYISILGFVCFLILFIFIAFNYIFVEQSSFVGVGSYLDIVYPYLTELFLLTFFCLFYIVFFQYHRNKIIEELLSQKVLELENDTFGYKKINKILTSNNYKRGLLK